MVLERFLLTDRVAIVTGAGRGIGAASAVALAEAGADVVVSSRTATQLDDVAAQIGRAGRRALVVPADLSDVENIAQLATEAHDTFGRLDVVINNVGEPFPTRSRYDNRILGRSVPLQRRDRTCAVSCRGAAHARYRRRGGGRHLFDHGPRDGRGYLAYGAAEAAPRLHPTRGT